MLEGAAQAIGLSVNNYDEMDTRRDWRNRKYPAGYAVLPEELTEAIELVTSFLGALAFCPSISNRSNQPACKIASGDFRAMRSNVRAAPDGSRRPCSHSCKVRTETPSNWAKTD